MSNISTRLAYFQANLSSFNNGNAQRTLSVQKPSLYKQGTGDRFEHTVRFTGDFHSIKRNVGKTPDGTDVTLEETIDFSANGQPIARRGQFIFDDPANNRKDGKGYIEYEAIVTPDHVDFQYIWNNSTKRGGIALVAWHLTNGIQRKKFIATDVKNTGMYDLAEKYNLKTDRKRKIITAPFDVVKTIAHLKLLLGGWKLE